MVIKNKNALNNLKGVKGTRTPMGIRGQLKIQQTIFMLIAVTLFFVFVGLFLLGMKFAGVKDSATTLEEKNAMLLATKLANSPEFACGEAFGSGRINCIDADKMMMLKENSAKYSNFWEVENIEVRKISNTAEENLCEINNYPNCEVIRLFPREIEGYAMSNFVALCRKASFEGEVYDKCEMARLIISYKEAGNE